MKPIVTLALLGAAIASQALAAAPAEKGKMLFASGGTRLGTVYKVTGDGSAQIIIDGKLITVPANTLRNNSGRLETSLSKSHLL